VKKDISKPVKAINWLAGGQGQPRSKFKDGALVLILKKCLLKIKSPCYIALDITFYGITVGLDEPRRASLSGCAFFGPKRYVI
jgi:hypothetical protein